MNQLPREPQQRPSRLSVLLRNRRLMVFVATLMAFHFANAAMLPLH